MGRSPLGTDSRPGERSKPGFHQASKIRQSPKESKNSLGSSLSGSGKLLLRHMPRSRALRVALGILFIIGGLLGMLPVLGFWMIPLGILILAVDIPVVRGLWKRVVRPLRRRRDRRAGGRGHAAQDETEAGSR